MKYRLTRHAKEEIGRRGLGEGMVDVVLQSPQQVVPGSGGRMVYQSQLSLEGGKIFLVRVVVDERSDPPAVITAYRTSNIDRYWRSEG